MLRALLLIAVVGMAMSTSAGRAQEERQAVRVILPVDLWASLSSNKTGNHALNIRVAGASCGGFGMHPASNGNFTPGGDLLWELLGPQCVREGVTVEFFMTSGERLAFHTVMTPGQDITIPSVEFDSAGPGEGTWLVIRGMPWFEPHMPTINYLDVTANWKDCGRILLAGSAAMDTDAEILHRLDASGLPADCSKDGMRLRVVTDQGYAFWQKPEVIAGGATYQFEFGPEPPHGATRPEPGARFWWLPWAMLGAAATGIVITFVGSKVRRYRRGY